MNEYPDKDVAIERLAQFIGFNRDLSTFLHHLRSRKVAEHILKSGFEFENHLSFTTDHLSGHDIVELGYLRSLRKAYGNIVLIIQIPNALIQQISSAIQRTTAHFSEALTVKDPVMGENDFPVYTLPTQYILGYFDMSIPGGIRNPHFDPQHVGKECSDNISKILSRNW